MVTDASPWARLVQVNPAVRFLDINLRGVGEACLQNNPVTGVFFLAAISWGAVTSGAPHVVLSVVLATLVATVTAIVLHADEIALKKGLFGFNGVLLGCAVPTFIEPSAAMWVLVLIGSATSTVLMLAMSNVMNTWNVPALSFPFVLTTWFLLLGAYSFGALTISDMGPPALAQPETVHSLSQAGHGMSLLPLLEAWLKGPAQVVFANNWISGILVVIGLVISSRWAAGLALAGAAIALGTSLALGGNLDDISSGLYGYTAVLTAVALGSTFYKPSWRVLSFTFLGTVFTVIVQGALDAALSPVGIPPLAAPFVFVTWLFLLPREGLKPYPHDRITHGVVGTDAPK